MIGIGHITSGLNIFCLCWRYFYHGASLVGKLAFTLAHTIIWPLPQPASLICWQFGGASYRFTIAFVAAENLLFKDVVKWQPVVVFVFLIQ